MGEGEKTVKVMKKIAKMNGKEVPKNIKVKHDSRLSKVPKEVYDSVLSLAEKQKQERANT